MIETVPKKDPFRDGFPEKNYSRKQLSEKTAFLFDTETVFIDETANPAD